MFLNVCSVKQLLERKEAYKEKKKNWKEKNRLEGLIYDKKKDEFTCPSGIKIKFWRIQEDITKTGYKHKKKIYRAEEGHCSKCPFHKVGKKTLHMSLEHERLKQIARSNLNSAKGI